MTYNYSVYLIAAAAKPELTRIALSKPALEQQKPSKETKPAIKMTVAASTPVEAPIVAPKKQKIVRIEGLDDGLREIPYGGTGLD